MAYAQALSDWARRGRIRRPRRSGTCARWPRSACPTRRRQWRGVTTLSGGEQKRLVLEALLRGPDEVLLLDEPDNYLDVPGKRWLEEQLEDTGKTVLFVSHDRELLARSAVEDRQRRARAGRLDVWVHGGGFGSFHEARAQRFERFEELRRRWDEKHAQLKKLVLDMRQYAGEQRRDGVPLRRRADAAAEVRGGRAAARAAAQAGHQDAAARRPHRACGPSPAPSSS